MDGKFFCSRLIFNRFVFYVIILFTVLPVLSGCYPAASSDSANCHDADSLKTLADIPGADMTFYRLYCEQYRDSALEAASASAETFLKSLDTSYCHPVAARMALELSNYYDNRKYSFTKAIRWSEYALNMYKKAGCRDKIAQTEYAIAELYHKLSRYDKVLMHIYPAIEYFDEQCDTLSLLPCYNILGQLYYSCRDFETSQIYLEKYEESARAVNDTVNIVYALNNLAALTKNPEDTTRVNQLLEEAGRLAMEYGDSLVYLKTTMTSTAFYVNSSQENKLKHCYSVLMDMKPVLSDPHDFIIFYYSLGSLYYHVKDFEKSAESLKSAINYCSLGEYQNLEKSCYYMLQGIYMHVGDIVNAYKNLQMYVQYYRHSSFMDNYIQLYKYQNELLLAQEQERIKAKRNHIMFVVLLVGFFFILLIIGVAIIIWNKHKKVRLEKIELRNRQLIQENKEQEIKFKNEQVEIRKMQQYQMHQMVNDVVDKLHKLSEQYSDLPLSTRLEEICADLKPHGDLSAWKEFNKFVPEFNSEFFKKLLKDFPDLTINERRLCALLNMNLTTKEISDITKQSIHSINIARGRLRSKLGIIGERSSIQEFLAKYN